MIEFGEKPESASNYETSQTFLPKESPKRPKANLSSLSKGEKRLNLKEKIDDLHNEIGKSI